MEIIVAAILFLAVVYEAHAWSIYREPFHRPKDRHPRDEKHHHDRHPRDVNNHTGENIKRKLVFDVENLFVCLNKECFEVKEFQIVQDFTPSCYKEELEISFELPIKNNPSKKTSNAVGFLNHKQDRGSSIKYEASKASETCQLIKR